MAVVAAAANDWATVSQPAERLGNAETVDPPPGGPTTVPAPDPDPAILAMGPTGRWPSDFPAYSTPATIVTDGSPAGLENALDRLARSGGVIEHPGDIVEVTLRRSGSAPIVVRPPLGRRAEYDVRRIRIEGSGVLLAGWLLERSVRVSDVSNSGVAWCEAASSLWFASEATVAGGRAHALMHEVVVREFRDGEDRIRVRATGTGAMATLDVVGSWVTGGSAAPPAHSDTIQTLNQSGGDTHVTISDSVIWPSWDKALQGSSDTESGFTIERSWIAEPSIANELIPGLNLGGYHAITAVADVRNSVLLGSMHDSYPVTVSNSLLYQIEGIRDGGANRNTLRLPHPPPAPSHDALDIIWHD